MLWVTHCKSVYVTLSRNIALQNVKDFVDITTGTIFQLVRRQNKCPEGESCERSEEMAAEYALKLVYSH